MKKLVLVAAMLALVLVVVAPALADDPRLDLNGDGEATLDEMVRVADLNGDGSITEADLAIAEGYAGAADDNAAEAGDDNAAETGSDNGTWNGTDNGTWNGTDNADDVNWTEDDYAADQYAGDDQYAGADQYGAETKALPPSGGATLLTLGAGILLAAGGSLLIARRLFQ